MFLHKKFQAALSAHVATFAFQLSPRQGKEWLPHLLVTHEQVKRLSDKDVEKYTKRYEIYVGSKITESLIDSFIFLVTKVVGMSVNIKDIDAYQKELRNDYILNKELSNLACNLALKCGRFLAAANAALITKKHIDFNSHLERKAEVKLEEQSSTTAERISDNSSN